MKPGVVQRTLSALFGPQRRGRELPEQRTSDLTPRQHELPLKTRRQIRQTTEQLRARAEGKRS